jgi:hypothetical protein
MSTPSPLVTEPSAPPPPAAPASALKRRLPRWLAALGGLGWFLWVGGGAVLPPTRIDWMMREDWAAHLFGWLFFRNAPWQLPLGWLPNHFYPYGTSVARTDSVPWAALLLKPFSGVLPLDFQYFGLWLALGFMLMGSFGARLVGSVSQRSVHQVLGGMLLALSPLMASRFGHPSLVSHWLLVGMIWLHLRAVPDARTAWRSMALAALLNALGAGTHPYLVAMLLPLAAALTVRLALDRVLGWARAAAATLAIAALDMLLFALFGHFTGSEAGAEGFGDFSADLATLINPMGWSRLLPNLPAMPRQGEGYGFLGAGGLLLAALALASVALRLRAARELPWRRALPVLVASLALAFYALSWRVTWLGQPVADLSALYAPLAKQTAAFRASGRFIWPLHYLLVCGAVLLVVRLWRQRPAVSAAALGLALALQAYDFRQDRSVLRVPTRFQRLHAPEWDHLKGAYRHLALFPPGVQWVCNYDEPLVNALAYTAYRLELTFNSGYAARTPPQLVEDCRATLPSGGLAADTAYVVTPALLSRFLQAGARCGVLEGLPLCVAGQRQDAFAQALARQPLHLPSP